MAKDKLIRQNVLKENAGFHPIGVKVVQPTEKINPMEAQKIAERSGKTIPEQQAVIAAGKFIKDIIGSNVKYVQKNVPRYSVKEDEGFR